MAVDNMGLSGKMRGFISTGYRSLLAKWANLKSPSFMASIIILAIFLVNWLGKYHGLRDLSPPQHQTDRSSDMGDRKVHLNMARGRDAVTTSPIECSYWTVSTHSRPCMIDGYPFTTHSLQDISLNPTIDEEIDSFRNKPIQLLPNYRNPCWFELVNITYSYNDNSVSLSHEGRLKYVPPHFGYMRRILRARDRDGDGTTWRLRCLPYFYIAGVSKCGTTDLASLLQTHKGVARPLRKELAYWNRIRYHVLQEGIGPMRFHEGSVQAAVPRPFRHYVDYYDLVAEKIRWKSRALPVSDRIVSHQITGDFTPNYLYDFDGWYKMSVNKNSTQPRRTIADIIHKLTPRARIVFILRNPTKRLFSEYLYFKSDREKSHANFRTLTRRAISVLDNCFRNYSHRTCIYNHDVNSKTMPLRLRVGHYFLFLRDWLQVFPRNQILITRLEDYAVNRTQVANQIAEFLGIGPFGRDIASKTVLNSRHESTRSLGDMTNETKTLIDEYYRPWNEKLSELLADDRFLWRDSERP